MIGAFSNTIPGFLCKASIFLLVMAPKRRRMTRYEEYKKSISEWQGGVLATYFHTVASHLEWNMSGYHG